MKLLFIMAMLLMINGHKSSAPFEGSITYRIDVTENTSEENQNNLPREVTSYHKNGKMSVSIPIDGLTFTIISNVNTDEVAFVMNAQGMKMALKTNKSKLISEIQDESNKARITHHREYKSIAGLKCHKATINHDNESSSIYIADQLNAEGFAWLFNKQLNGTLMSFRKTDKANESDLHIYATKVSAHTVNDSHFELPPDHIMISISDLSNLFENGLFQ